MTDPTVFDLVELDLVATHVGVPFPFPLRVPSVGRTADERAALLGAAAEALEHRGLADRYGPTGVAADLAAALREHRAAVDLVVADAGFMRCVVAMVHGAHAVICRQESHHGLVLVTRATALADALAREIPPTPPAPTLPLAVPPGVVAEAVRMGDSPANREAVRRLVRAGGGDPGVVDQLIDLIPAVVGRGQFGVVRRSDPTTRPIEVSWLDTPRGRLRIDIGADGWVSVNTMRHSDLIRALGDVAIAARA